MLRLQRDGCIRGRGVSSNVQPSSHPFIRFPPWSSSFTVLIAHRPIHAVTTSKQAPLHFRPPTFNRRSSNHNRMTHYVSAILVVLLCLCEGQTFNDVQSFMVNLSEGRSLVSMRSKFQYRQREPIQGSATHPHLCINVKGRVRLPTCQR